MIKIKVLEDIRCFKKGELFVFTEPTLLIGSNGSGKSTLLRALRGFYGYKFGTGAHWDTSEYDNKNLAKYFSITTDIKEGVFFDAVLDDTARQTTDASSFISSGGFWLNHKSHGEATFYLLDKCLKGYDNVTNKLVVLDEFDDGFSIEQQLQSKKLLKRLSEISRLVIVASHSYLVIKHSGYRLWCMDTKQFITLEQFLKRCDDEYIFS